MLAPRHVRLFLSLRGARLLLLEAVAALAWARLRVRGQPFRKVAARLGQQGTETPCCVAPLQAADALRIGSAVRAVADHLPWECLCLVQAVAVMTMLRRRRISGTLYLGVGLDTKSSVAAHAWVRCGDHVVVGGGNLDRFRVVERYGTPP
ncbi:MAG TPA: lasso peptide biosynthesis B2 protein [Armatimonadota bacterium]|jgi:hypothetical protein